VVLTNTSATDPSAPIELFSVDLKLSSSAIHFTNADTNTVSPYIFSLTGNQGLIITQPTSPPPFSSSEVAANDIAALDASDNPQAQALAPLQTLGLLHVTFSVEASAHGPYPVALVDLGLGTSLVDIGSMPVDFTPLDGTINIHGASIVPEPSSLAIVATIAVFSMLRHRYARAAVKRRKP
jgi:hypothetical protein